MRQVGECGKPENARGGWEHSSGQLACATLTPAQGDIHHRLNAQCRTRHRRWRSGCSRDPAHLDPAQWDLSHRDPAHRHQSSLALRLDELPVSAIESEEFVV